ncbi:DNA repair protein RecO [Candidatus Woesebacteria bacterium]|nr:DNA repair protein RecO [Candidatus Woesebacteria bacterium]
MAYSTTFEGFVLKKYTLLEMTQSITVFTKQRGKMHFIVKGGQKITSRRSSHLQTGNLIGIDAASHPSGTWYVRSTNLQSGFSILKESEDKTRVLYNILLVLDRMLPLEQEEGMVYEMLLRAIVHLNSVDAKHDDVLFAFVREICETLGYGRYPVTTYDDIHEVMNKVIDEQVRFVI